MRLTLSTGLLCLIGMLLVVAGFALPDERLERVGLWLTLPHTALMGLLMLALMASWLLRLLLWLWTAATGRRTG